jgi:hypothetical protein
MNNKFDELARGVAQSVTRRQALKKFGLGLAGFALAIFGVPRWADAGSGKLRGYWCCYPLGGGPSIACTPDPYACPPRTGAMKHVRNCTEC